MIDRRLTRTPRPRDASREFDRALAVDLTSTDPERVDRVPYETALGSGLVDPPTGGPEGDLPNGLFFQDPGNLANFNLANLDFADIDVAYIIQARNHFVARVNGDLCNRDVSWGAAWAPHPDYGASSAPLWAGSGRYFTVYSGETKNSSRQVKPGTLTVTATVTEDSAEIAVHTATYTVLPPP